MENVEKFFHYICPLVISLTNKRFERTSKIIYKDDEYSPNYATEGDLDNENLIVSELNKWFPDDKIIAEETAQEVKDVNGRNWIVDPICGSSNFKNGVKFFSTNIALAKDGELIAACVIDHSREEYIWSTGNNILNIDNKVIRPEKRSMGVVVEVDLSAVMGQSINVTQRQTKLVSYLLENKKYYLAAFNTSLGFAYAALGRINAYASGYNKVWDVAAANFLIEQAGGVVTEMNGSKWNLHSNSVLASIDLNLHAELLNILNS